MNTNTTANTKTNTNANANTNTCTLIPIPGLLPRMVCSVFDYMEHSGEHMQFMIQVQFLEIYNEKIRDLLSPDKDNLKIR